MFGKGSVKEVPYDGYGYRVPADPAKENWDYGQTLSIDPLPDEIPVEETPKVVKSRIRVLLSRPLTWAEKEWLETDKLDPHSRRINGSSDTGLKLWVAPNFEHVWGEAEFGSRILFELVAEVLDTHFVNVFPKAVRTFREYNGD